MLTTVHRATGHVRVARQGTQVRQCTMFLVAAQAAMSRSEPSTHCIPGWVADSVSAGLAQSEQDAVRAEESSCTCSIRHEQAQLPHPDEAIGAACDDGVLVERDQTVHRRRVPCAGRLIRSLGAHEMQSSRIFDLFFTHRVTGDNMGMAHGKAAHCDRILG